MDAKAYQGEVRALRDGRVKRLEGDRPDRRVFPGLHSDTTLPLRLTKLPEPTAPTVGEISSSEESVSEEFPPSPEVKEPYVAKAQRLSPTFRYEWTSKGYTLQPDYPMKPPQGSSTGTVRPVVTVEPRGPGPFPAEIDPTEVSPTSTGLFYYPEIDVRDKALAQSALREWFSHPSVTQTRPVSPDGRKTPEVEPRFSVSPGPPGRRRSPPLSPSFRPRLFDPLAFSSEFKTSLEAEGPPEITYKPGPQSDWGTDVPAALLSFGRPIRTEIGQPEKSVHRDSAPSRPVSDTKPHRPYELKTFPSQYPLESEIKRSPSPPLTTGISPPSNSHPLLSQTDLRPPQLQSSCIENLEPIPPSSSLLLRSSFGVFGFPKTEQPLENIPQSLESTKISIGQSRTPPQLFSQQPTEPPPALPEVQLYQVAPKSSLGEIPSIQPSPRPPTDSRILSSGENIERKRLDSGNGEIYRRHLEDDDEESQFEFRRDRRQSSIGKLIDDLTVSPKSGELYRGPFKTDPLASALHPAAPIPPKSSQFSARSIPAVSSPQFDPTHLLSESLSSKFSFDEGDTPSPKTFVAPSSLRTHSQPVLPISISTGSMKNFSHNKPLMLASKRSADESIPKTGASFGSKLTPPLNGSLHPKDAKELEIAGELFGFKVRKAIHRIWCTTS